MIRNNTLIKDITTKGKECWLLQYADDTVLLLDDGKNSLKSALSLFDQFSSGLKPNYEKTRCIKIGSLRYDSVLPDELVHFNWSQELFTVLGITYRVSLESNSMFELKFTPKIKEIKELICSWSRKILSTAERITVVKSLILPKITHLLISLPNPPKEKIKEIEFFLYQYIWNSKTPRVA